MQKRQPKHEALKCTYKDCQRLQTMDGEFCPKHYGMPSTPARTFLSTPTRKEQLIMADIIINNLMDDLEACGGSKFHTQNVNITQADQWLKLYYKEESIQTLDLLHNLY